MEDKKIALRVDEIDNVATVFSNSVFSGDEIEVIGKQGTLGKIKVLSDIPFGHKIALLDIAAGDHIMKYGQSIGAASQQIRKGEYVHIHNMVALRGRGDLEQEG